METRVYVGLYYFLWLNLLWFNSDLLLIFQRIMSYPKNPRYDSKQHETIIKL